MVECLDDRTEIESPSVSGALPGERDMAQESLLPMVQELASEVRLLEREKEEAVAKTQALEREVRDLSKQKWHIYKGVVLFLLAFGIALVPLIYIGFVHNNLVGYLVFLAILLVSYFLFNLWVDGYAERQSHHR